MKHPFLWLVVLALVVAAAWLVGFDEWLKGGRPLSIREGSFMMGLGAVYVAWLAHQSMREGFGNVDRELLVRDQTIRNLRISNASTKAFVIRAVGPKDGETNDEVNERADRLFIAELEEIDPELAETERKRQAEFKAILAEGFYTVRRGSPT